MNGRMNHNPEVYEALNSMFSGSDVEANDALWAMTRGTWVEEIEDDIVNVTDPYFIDEEW